ncbi:MAG: hypothetical protein N2645_00235 [Clostridia bacterium]|nr:hypothetical protein [Clostridia bacterium]
MGRRNLFNIGNILDIIFKATRKNASYLANHYLLKDKSVISKWKNNGTNPRSEDIASIIRFAVNESTEVQRKIIQNKIEDLILSAPLEEDLKQTILNAKSFDRFIEESVHTATSIIDKDNTQSIMPFSDVFDDNTQSIVREISPGKNIEGKYKGIVNLELELVSDQENHEKIEAGCKKKMSFRNNELLNKKYLIKKPNSIRSVRIFLEVNFNIL